jgi:hypothetical protein
MTPFQQEAELTVQRAKSLPAEQKVYAINRLVNERVRYVEDQGDYFQEPAETLQRGTGDCEDSAILKTALLLQAGIPVAELFLDVLGLYAQNASAGHVVGNWRNKYILELKQYTPELKSDPLPRDEYYDVWLWKIIPATSCRVWSYPADMFFPGGKYDTRIRNENGLTWASAKYQTRNLFAGLMGRPTVQYYRYVP